MSSAARARTTNAPAASGIGWSKGMACQLSFPNISVLPTCQQRHRAGCGILRGRGSLSRRQPLVHDVLEESGLHAPIGVWAYILALLQQLPVSGLIQHGTSGARS